MSIIDEMERDQESVEEYHCLEIIDDWCRAGGSLTDLYDTLAFWPKCRTVARERTGGHMIWCHVAEASEELLVEAKAALLAGRLEELTRTWWPEGVPRQPAKVA